MPVADHNPELCPDCLQPMAEPHQNWCPMKPPTANDILATYDERTRDARKQTPGGRLFRHDLVGIIKAVANIHGVTPERVRELVEARYE